MSSQTIHSTPVITLIGRPNVGKSTFFNIITNSRDALVADYVGLTRDRQYGIGKIADRNVIVVDTGGMINDKKMLQPQQGKRRGDDWELVFAVNEQIETAIKEADVIVLIFDSRAGLTSEDMAITKRLRKYSKKFFVVANKIDGENFHDRLAEFYRIGVDKVFPTTATQRRGVPTLLSCIDEYLSEHFDSTHSILESHASEETEQKQHKRIKVALIGRPNVGKSTLVNRMTGENRVVVSEIAGTTRDSVYIDCDVELTTRGKSVNKAPIKLTLIDTAGIRKRKNIVEALEKFSIIKTLSSITAADMVLVLVDGVEGLVDQDLHLLGHVINSGKPAVLAINKCDQVDETARKSINTTLERRLQFADFIQTQYLSAKTGRGLNTLYTTLQSIYNSATQTIKTSYLNQILNAAVQQTPPPRVGSRKIKPRYVHVGGKNPLLIIVHGTQVESLPNNYIRYLQRIFRERLDLRGMSVKLQFSNSENPFKDKKNVLTKGQVASRQRMLKHQRKR